MILFFLLRGEQAERRAAVSKMLEIVEADVANKAAQTDRLKAQDDALGKILDKVSNLQQRPAP